MTKKNRTILFFLILGLNHLTQAQQPAQILASTYDKKTSQTTHLTAEPKTDTASVGCVDLVLDSIKVLQMTGNAITLEYCICNKGTLPAPIYGDMKSMKSHVAVHFYFSGTPRITRGSVFADGIFVTEGLKATKGMLAPGTSVKQTMKLSLEKKISYFKVIVLQVDAMNVIENECDETNNVGYIIPKW